MKYLATLMILLCVTTVSMAQSTVTKEVITTEGEDGKESKVVKKYKIITTKDIDVDIDKDDMKEGTLKKLMEVLSEFEEGDGKSEKIIVKTINISDENDESFKVKILSDGEVKTLEGSENIDLDKIKIKIEELSEKLEDSEEIKMILKTIEEIEEKEEKDEKKKNKKKN